MYAIENVSDTVDETSCPRASAVARCVCPQSNGASKPPRPKAWLCHTATTRSSSLVDIVAGISMGIAAGIATDIATDIAADVAADIAWDIAADIAVDMAADIAVDISVDNNTAVNVAVDTVADTAADIAADIAVDIYRGHDRSNPGQYPQIAVAGRGVPRWCPWIAASRHRHCRGYPQKIE